MLGVNSKQEVVAKITDFGLAKQTDHRNLAATHCGCVLFIYFVNDIAITELCFYSPTTLSTLLYMAPELLRADPLYTNSVDIWAAGIIMYQLLCSGSATSLRFTHAFFMLFAFFPFCLLSENPHFLHPQFQNSISLYTNLIATFPLHYLPIISLPSLSFLQNGRCRFPQNTQRQPHLPLSPSPPTPQNSPSPILRHFFILFFLLQLSRHYLRVPRWSLVLLRLWGTLCCGHHST